VDENEMIYRPLCRFDKPEEEIFALSWSPDGTKLASAHRDYVVRVWDVRQKESEPLHQLIHRKYPVSIAWSPDGRWIATGDTQADVIRIWDSVTGKQQQELYHHQTWVTSLDWHPDGQQLVSGGMDGKIVLWDTASWQVLQEIPVDQGIYTVRYSPDGKVIAFSDGSTLCVWTDTVHTLKKNNTSQNFMGNSVVWCKADGDKLASVHGQGMINLWRVGQQKMIGHLSQNGIPAYRFQSIDWSPDGKELLLVCGDEFVRLWNEGLPEQPLSVTDDQLFAAGWSPDGNQIAAAGENGVVYLWEREG
jgi:WD40 repeat protein